MMDNTNEIINRAIASSDRLLTIIEFVTATGVQIDTFMITKFWAGLQENKLIYIDDELICWLGYTSIEAYSRKTTFMKLLPVDGYKHLTYDQYKEFLATNGPSGYPPLPTGRNLDKIKHILITPRTLRLCIMKLGTSRGDRIREYYADLEDLFRVYTAYQARYKDRAHEAELAELRTLCTDYTRKCAIKELDSAIEGRVGCVYFIRCGDRVKIGYTYNLRERISEIQVCCPREITLVRSILSERPAELETELHLRFAECRKIGEWFEISDDEVLRVEEY